MLSLVLLLALPSLALIIYWGVEARNQAIEDAKGECLEFVNAIAGEQQAELVGVQQLMSTLALLPEVQSKNSPATNALLSDLVKKNPLFANIVISDKAGLVWASAIPFEEKISLVGRRYFQQAVLSGVFSSGEFALGRIVNKPVITFAQPISTSSNDLRGVIAVSLNLDHFQTMFERVALPAGSSFSLLDHRGIILYRNSRDALSEQLAGKRDVREDLFTRMVGEHSEGTYEAVGNDERERLVAYKKLILPHEVQPYLYIRSSILRDTVVSQANAAMVKRMAASASVFAVGLILALLIAKRMIVSPIEKLKKASLQLTAGPTLVNVSENVKEGELGELAKAFDGMAKALLQKEEEHLADEQVLKFEREQLLSLFDSMDSLIYVSDPSTNEILYMNKTMEKIFGKRAVGGICYRELQGLEVPCAFCTNEIILRQDPTPYYWEYYNPKIDRNFTIIDRIIKWPDGRKVRFEVATDVTERKQAEEKTIAAHRQTQSIIDNTPDIVYAFDLEGHFMIANTALAELLNSTPEQLIGKRRHEFMPKEDADWHEANDRQVIEVARALEFEEYNQLQERSITWLTTKFPLRDGQGKIYAVAGISSDISQRKQTEEALRKAKDELEERVKERTYELYAESLYARSLIEASIDPLVTISPEGKITDVNHSTEEVTGLSREQLIGSDFSYYFTEPEKAKAGYEEVFRKGIVRDYPLELKNRDGHVTPVLYNASVYRDKTGQILGVFAAARDITERRRAEETIKAERQRLYDVLETLPVYAILLTPDYHVTFANRFFRERFGEDCGRRCYEYLFSLAEPCEVCETYTVRRTGEPHHWEWKGPDGRVYDIHDFPFTDVDGSSLIMEVGIDITERKEAEATLRKLASELVMAEERERKRVATVLHDEIAQTLAAVKMRMDVLKGTPTDQEPTLRDAKKLLAQSIRETRALMNDLGNPLLFDLGLKAACESLAERLMESHPIRIRCSIQDTFKNLSPDVKTILFQLIRELLTNIVKHSKARTADVSVHLENGVLEVRVMDDGVGFDPQTLGAPTAEGGFGLYSIRERLAAIRGSLRIESDPRNGTVVTATLPTALDATPSAGTAQGGTA